MSRPHIAAGFAAAVLLTLTACSGGDAAPSEAATPVASSNAASEPAMSADTSEATKESAMAEAMPGAFIDYADYQADQAMFADNDVVLFFNATWCPTCQEATKNLTAEKLPDGLTVVSVDYDSNLDLRRDYGVTTQHTFVQVDPAGEELAKFTGATTGQEISEQLS